MKSPSPNSKSNLSPEYLILKARIRTNAVNDVIIHVIQGLSLMTASLVLVIVYVSLERSASSRH